MKTSLELHSKASFTWLVKMAWRDAKASAGKLLLFMASIILGIAAVVSIQSFGENLKENLALQSKSMMGTDYKIDTNTPPSEEVLAIIDSLGGYDAREINFASMAVFPGKDASKLIQLRGIEGDFPFYGNLETEPVEAASSYQTNGGALVDATLMLQLGLKTGDTVKVGDSYFPIEGALKAIPGSNAIFSAVAPNIVIPYSYIKQTGLVQTGSRIDYEFYFVTSPKINLEELSKKWEPRLDALNADLDTHLSTSQRLGQRYDNFGKFLNLVAFIALLLGCIGIASAIHIYIKEKLPSVALLKCLGATKRQSFLIYLLQIAGLGLLGGILGTLLGLFLQLIFPIILGDLLPVDVSWSFSTQVILMGLILGVLMSVLFALYPLMSTLYVSPLQSLKAQILPQNKSRWASLSVLVAIFGFIFVFAFFLLDKLTYALAFVVGVIITFSILAAVAHLFMKLIKTFFPASWSFEARQSLLNLFRPQNQTLILIVTIGVGCFLISTLYFSKDLLLAQASFEERNQSPNLILLDVQSNQDVAVADMLSKNQLPILENMPIVTMRIEQIKNKSVNEIKKDSASKVRRWILNHEFRTTYRSELSASESISEGEWVSQAGKYEVVPISVSDNFASDAKVTVGDAIVFNVQGVITQTVVSSIRSVDWSQARMNFTVVFPKGVLEEAPQFRVVTSRVPDEQTAATIQQQLVQNFPNVTVIDVRQVIKVVEDLLDKISWLINFMAFFSILTGIIVLLGAVRTSKYRRIRENTLLRTLGAQSRQILKITALEYLFLGMLGSFLGILLALIGTQLLALLVYETPFVPSLIPILILFVGITVLVVTIGLINSISVIKSPPLEVLRKEN